MMLSRTADHLYWMARYMERAENTARMLDINYQTSLLPQSAWLAHHGWQGMLAISELTTQYEAKHGDIDARRVLDFMVRDPSNPSSIYSCVQAARENARAVRGSLTTEFWETHNSTWLELPQHLASGALERDPAAVFEWVKYRSHLSRGVALGTMLADDSMRFIRLGTFLERADNTARLLDAKFHALETPESREYYGSSTRDQHEVEFYHWVAVLRSVSGFEVYRKVYRNVVRPERVAELLILREDMPRSLLHCMEGVVPNLRAVANQQSGETLRRAGRLRSDLRYARIDEILATGLHSYLTQFLERINDVGAGISRDFLVPVA